MVLCWIAPLAKKRGRMANIAPLTVYTSSKKSNWSAWMGFLPDGFKDKSEGCGKHTCGMPAY